MRERLPGITIKPDVTPTEFLERLYHVVPEQQVWKVKHFEKRLASQEDYPALGLAYIGCEPEIPDGLMAHLAWNIKLDKDRVRVQMIAQNWGVEDLSYAPSYDSYAGAAYMLRPLLSIYNRRHRARVRLNIESREDLMPRLSPKAKEFFDPFVSRANKVALHPSDWEPFYDFVIVCHRLRSKLKEDDIKYLLVQQGFSEEYALTIAGVYRHGREILKRPRDPISARRFHQLWDEHFKRGQSTDA